jgi:hypothetical protein
MDFRPWTLDLVSIFDVGTMSGSFPYPAQRKRNTKAPERVESSNRKDEAALQFRCSLALVGLCRKKSADLLTHDEISTCN